MKKKDIMSPGSNTDVPNDLEMASRFSARKKQLQLFDTNVTGVHQVDGGLEKGSGNRSQLRRAINFLKSRFGHKKPVTASISEDTAFINNSSLNSPCFSDVEISGIEAAELRQEAATIDPYSYIQTRTGIQPSAIAIFKDRQIWAVEVGLDGTGRLPPVFGGPGTMSSTFGWSTASSPCATSPWSTTEVDPIANSFALREASLLDMDKCKKRVEMHRAALRFKKVDPQTLKDIAEDPNLCETLDKEIFPMDLDCLLRTRLDKLVEDILIAKHGECHECQEIRVNGNSTSQIFIESLIPAAKRLQERWQENLGASYSEIDEIRRRYMMGSEGSMRGITFNPGSKTIDPLFTVTDSYRFHNRARNFGDQGFKPGQWWLNTWCAFRDGMLAQPDKQATQVNGAVTALLLLQGVEVDGPEVDTYEYVIKVQAGETMSSLLGQRGRPIRLLRGHQLQSRYAPQVGSRYDGLYDVSTYSLKLVENSETPHELKIILRQRPDQLSMEKLSLIPTPEQMDEWKIFERLLDEHFQALDGEE